MPHPSAAHTPFCCGEQRQPRAPLRCSSTRSRRCLAVVQVVKQHIVPPPVGVEGSQARRPPHAAAVGELRGRLGAVASPHWPFAGATAALGWPAHARSAVQQPAPAEVQPALPLAHPQPCGK